MIGGHLVFFYSVNSHLSCHSKTSLRPELYLIHCYVKLATAHKPMFITFATKDMGGGGGGVYMEKSSNCKNKTKMADFFFSFCVVISFSVLTCLMSALCKMY